MAARVNTRDFKKRLRVAFRISVPYILASSVLGFFLLFAFYSQYGSGFLLSLLYLPDPSFVVVLREEINAEVQ